MTPPPPLAGAAAGTNSGQDKIFISRLIGSDVLPTSLQSGTASQISISIYQTELNDLNHDVYFSYLSSSLVIEIDYIMIILIVGNISL